MLNIKYKLFSVWEMVICITLLLPLTDSEAASWSSLASLTPLATKFSSDASYTVCFTPGENCTKKIVDLIDQAQHSILVQVYSINSYSIRDGLIRAKQRGVAVKIIVDKSMYLHRPAAVDYLLRHDVAIWVDHDLFKNGVAHNKVMIIDDHYVITGSFNFTFAAQKRNVENLLIIEDRKLVRAYEENWRKRLMRSCRLSHEECRDKIATDDSSDYQNDY